jgi:hypothetical protein
LQNVFFCGLPRLARAGRSVLWSGHRRVPAPAPATAGDLDALSFPDEIRHESALISNDGSVGHADHEFLSIGAVTVVAGTGFARFGPLVRVVGQPRKVP